MILATTGEFFPNGMIALIAKMAFPYGKIFSRGTECFFASTDCGYGSEHARALDRLDDLDVCRLGLQNVSESGYSNAYS